ncbi:MAG: geranylgeranylglyceryl/heptaprenylglyceryl phosphate synthase [Flavobacteriaceae bacterium]|nr:MAG: geranylgeranylglyceryl/heptaprenylglyceryl phosphate synthase [Flavobacteriaceae bacterium]
MNKNILQHIINSKQKGKKLLAILLDPDKVILKNLESIISKITINKVDFIFVGGSTVHVGVTDKLVKKIKKLTTIPIILFPGDYTQLTNNADAVLFLSLLSGRNPEYLINQQIKSVEFLKNSDLEIIPTAYILIDGGVETSVQKVSKTTPISQSNIDEIINTTMASQYLGKQLIYLEAGSGATKAVDSKIIKKISENVEIPIIVGGGIRSKKQLETAFENGADLVVIGTAFEENNSILSELK